ncbi:Shewanella-like protein phosphatase 2 [Turnera subulata]|uniref:Shewanella-like protein phosphatase 2 n=1 Tax=Turnera subulata TaxID=218843 RepID=A0A9Q0G591_9ROSI|nr:Shewanella-like protein phosphatase 2 [Turnera subulata]
MEDGESPLCKNLPNLVSSFVDTFVDFTVSGGLFSPSAQNHPDPTPPQPAAPKPLQTRYPAPPRLVAVGDLHGDLEKTKQSLRLAGVIDGQGQWAGGSSTVVQVGDVLDRGGEELKILYFLEKLKREASKAGGRLITMNGNHEVMNVEGDFRFVTKSGLEEFENWANWYSLGEKIKGLVSGEKRKDLFDGIPLKFRGVKDDCVNGIRARIAALRPDGPVARRFLGENVTVLVVGDSVFVHGGLLPEHVEYGLERINKEVRDWVNGFRGKHPPGHCKGRDAVVWLRKFSDEKKGRCDCSALEHVLATVPGARRMIMGHTIQQSGINGACENRAIRIDVGMSKGCINGLPEVLEIVGGSELRVLTSNPAYQGRHKGYSEANGKERAALLIPAHGVKQVEVKA